MYAVIFVVNAFVRYVGWIYLASFTDLPASPYYQEIKSRFGKSKNLITPVGTYLTLSAISLIVC